MLYVVIMVIYANYDISFNEFPIDSLEDIDYNLFETMVYLSCNITDFVVYLQDETNKERYNYHSFVGYTDIDHDSYITHDGNCKYSYHGINIEPLDV